MSTERHDIGTPHGIASARAALSAIDARLHAANPESRRENHSGVNVGQCSHCLRFYDPEMKACPGAPDKALETVSYEVTLLNVLQDFYALAREYVDRH